MFIENKYTKWYMSIVLRAKDRQRPIEYCEVHHIVPKSLGGSRSKENEVLLTGREHYVCHLLLTKMLVGEFKKKMIYAFILMSTHGLTKNDQSRGFKKLNSRLFQNLRKEFCEAVSHDRKGKPVVSKNPEITKAKRSSKLKGRQFSEETKKKMSQSAKARTSNRTGKKVSDESRQRMREAALKREALKRVYQ